MEAKNGGRRPSPFLTGSHVTTPPTNTIPSAFQSFASRVATPPTNQIRVQVTAGFICKTPRGLEVSGNARGLLTIGGSFFQYRYFVTVFL